MIPDARQDSAEQAVPQGTASQQLRDCSHFIALLADQLEALEQQDFPRLRELETLRSRLTDEMGARSDPETPVLIWIAEQVEEALSRVGGWIELEQSRREQLSQLQDDSLPLVRGFHRPVGTGNYHSLDSSRTRLDLRL